MPGLLFFTLGNRETSDASHLQLWARSYPGKPGERVVYPYSEAKLDFAARQSYRFIWQGYDPCPVCKAAAEARPVRDLLGRRMGQVVTNLLRFQDNRGLVEE